MVDFRIINFLELKEWNFSLFEGVAGQLTLCQVIFEPFYSMRIKNYGFLIDYLIF